MQPRILALALAFAAVGVWLAWPAPLPPVEGPRPSTPTEAVPALPANPSLRVPEFANIIKTMHDLPTPAGLGKPIEVRLPLRGGGAVVGKFWPPTTATAPAVVFAPGPRESPVPFAAVLAALRGQRDVGLVLMRPDDVAPLPHAGLRWRRELERLQVVAALVRKSQGNHTFDAGSLAVVASGDAAVAALHLAAADPGVRAAALLSLPTDATGTAWDEAVETVARRQLFMAWTAADTPVHQALVARLHNGKGGLVPGAARGVALLQTPGVASDLSGWLYAALGPIDRQVPSAP